MTNPHDEVAAFKAALDAEDWRRLLAPDAEALLTLALLDDTLWWKGESGPDVLFPHRGAYENVHLGLHASLTSTGSVIAELGRTWVFTDSGTPESWAAIRAYTMACFEATQGDVADQRRVLALLEKFAP